jgi:adenine deaminase
MSRSKNFTLEGNILDPVNRRSGFGKIGVVEGRIAEVQLLGPEQKGQPYILPGFVDAHIHIESSMLTPPAFARMAVRHGTVATVSDPHEIANVCGIEGVRYMVDLGKRAGFKFFFGAPSCVPATPFETAGATLTVEEIIQLFEEKSCSYLSEMMNYPAVLSRDPLVMDKIAAAHRFGLPVDGHAPGLKGSDAHRYASAGITTDHECTTLEEALDKIAAGMHIIIREGSAAKNYNALHSLIRQHPAKVMFCSDDKHPDDLMQGHINHLVARSLTYGYDLMDVLTIACVNPVKHYQLNVGLLQPGDPADMILVEDIDTCKVISTWLNGIQVYESRHVHLPHVDIPVINAFGIDTISPGDLRLNLKHGPAKIIVAIDGAIVTRHEEQIMEEGSFEGDVNRDILKLVVLNRYSKTPPAIALIKGFGLKSGAIATSVAHDSHNIIAVGTNDSDLAACINKVIQAKGGLCALGKMHGIPETMATPTMTTSEFENLAYKELYLPLPVAGLMSDEADGETIGKLYSAVDLLSKQWLGCTLSAPFMTLSFMALLVIPTLKLSDLGLFDGTTFQFTPLQP